MILTSTEGQGGLPRHLPAVLAAAARAPRGRIDFVLPDGRRFRAEGAGPGHVAEVAVHDFDVFARLLREGQIGFAEAYLDGGWSSPDLLAFMDWLGDGADDAYDGFPGAAVARAWERARHWLRRNTRRQAQRNIAHHYDLGNDFYALWLDPSMTYSSALFDGGVQSLEAAQRAKYASLVDRLGVGAGAHVLEIGCGWGGFAEYAAAERGLRVTGLTISRAQLDFARGRIARAGLSDRVELRLQDYRDERGTYDGVASVEMFEAVGERYWPAYFDTLVRCLRPGGRAALQVITIAEARWEAYRGGVDFIQKHVFPGGMLPSPARLRGEAERAGLRAEGSLEFGESYSHTLRLWLQAFEARWAEVAALGFDDRFRRMWTFYLASCAAAFHAGRCDVTQIALGRPA